MSSATHKNFHSWESSGPDRLSELYLFLFLTIAGSISLIYSVVKDVKEYKKTRKLKSCLASIVGLAFIVIVISISSYYQNLTLAPSLVGGYAVYDVEDNSDRRPSYVLDCKLDGNYYFNKDVRGSHQAFYGKYKMRDSIIELDRKFEMNGFTTNLFLVRVIKVMSTYDQGVDTSYVRNIFLLDRDKKIINSGFKFLDESRYICFLVKGQKKCIKTF